jgi:hypothetical protein
MTAARPTTSARRRVAVLVATALAVELLYFFVVTAGTFTHWHFYAYYLNDLADGFRQGHLRMAIEPPPGLVANPANTDLWYWDVSLYRNHFYLYWGPLPALGLAVAKTVLRIKSQVGDEHVVFWLTTLQLAAGTLLIERMGRRLFARAPLALEVAAVLVLGTANPTLYDLGRAAAYEAAIVGAQAFVLLGLVFAFDAVVDDQARWRSLIGAGTAWAGTLSCRISIAPVVVLLAALTILGVAAGRPERLRRAARAALGIGAPLALGLFLLLLYNRLRFDAWLEFGRRYQMDWLTFGVGKQFLTTNLYAYFWRPLVISCRFPFLYTIMGWARAFPEGYKIPADYRAYEQVAGLVPTVPWLWFALAAMVAAIWRLRRTRAFSPFVWIVAATATATVVGLSFDLMLSSATNRFLGDAIGVVVLLAALGAFAAAEALQPWPWAQRGLIGVAVLLAVLSTWAGFALGFKGQYNHFEQGNPTLYRTMVERFSVCHGQIPPEPK